MHTSHACLHLCMHACTYTYISKDDEYDPLNSGGDDDILNSVGDNNKFKLTTQQFVKVECISPDTVL